MRGRDDRIQEVGRRQPAAVAQRGAERADVGPDRQVSEQAIDPVADDAHVRAQQRRERARRRRQSAPGRAREAERVLVAHHSHARCVAGRELRDEARRGTARGIVDDDELVLGAEREADVLQAGRDRPERVVDHHDHADAGARGIDGDRARQRAKVDVESVEAIQPQAVQPIGVGRGETKSPVARRLVMDDDARGREHDLAPGVPDLEAQVDVLAAVHEGFVEATVLAKDLGADEHAGGGDRAQLEAPVAGVRRLPRVQVQRRDRLRPGVSEDHAAVLDRAVGIEQLAADHRDRRIGLYLGDHRRQPARRGLGVIIEKEQVLAGGQRRALVRGPREPQVGGVARKADVVQAGQLLRGLVAGGVVDDDHLVGDLARVLGDRQQALPGQLPFVENGDDDRDRRREGGREHARPPFANHVPPIWAQFRRCRQAFWRMKASETR